MVLPGERAKAAVTQVEQGMLGMQGGYVTYRVSASAALPGSSAPSVAVRRRFRDFVVRASPLSQASFCRSRKCP